MDLLAISNDETARLRSLIHEKHGIVPDTIMLHATQNHSAPTLGKYYMFAPDSPYVKDEHWWMHGGDRSYPGFATPRILPAVQQAVAALQPVRIGIGHGMDGRVGFNRRFVKRDGTVQTIPGGHDLLDILHVEDPTDPEVAVVCFYGENDKIIAALLHHTAHPVSLWGTRKVTASWPGAWCKRFKELAGQQCVPLVINGCCGNISTSNPLDRGHQSDDDAIAQRLMQTTGEAMGRIRPVRDTASGYVSRRLAIPRPVMDPEELRDAQALFEREPQHAGETMSILK